MPSIKPGESEKDYVGRCIPYVIKKEGLDQKQAAGKCFGIYRNKNESNIIKKIDMMLGDQTTSANVDMTQGPYGVNLFGMRYKKKKKKVKGELGYTVHENKVSFDQKKMMKLIKKDKFLKSVYKPGMSLKTLFNTYVLGDTSMEKEYLNEAKYVTAKRKGKEMKIPNDPKVIKKYKDMGYEILESIFGATLYGIEGSQQTRAVGDYNQSIEVLKRSPRPIRFSKLLGGFIPKNTDEKDYIGGYNK